MTWQTPADRQALKLRARVTMLERERDDLGAELQLLRSRLERGRGPFWRRRRQGRYEG
jgi:hypothetical protein